MTKTAQKTKASATAAASENMDAALRYDVRIEPRYTEGNVRATASVNISGQFAVRGVNVVEGKNGLFVSLPAYKNGKGEYKDICFPCTKEARIVFDHAVLSAYEQALAQNQTEGLNREAPDPFGYEPQSPAMQM